jgi:hypothetical protein
MKLLMGVGHGIEARQTQRPTGLPSGGRRDGTGGGTARGFGGVSGCPSSSNPGGEKLGWLIDEVVLFDAGE